MSNKSVASIFAIASSSLLTPAFACSPDYSDISLRIATATGYIPSTLKVAAESWQELTCGEVEIVEFPYVELYPKLVTSLTSSGDAFDGITFAPSWTPDLAAYLDPMPKSMRSGSAWEDIHPAYREQLMVWDGEVLSQSIDGDLHALSYRIDLFEDPANKKEFSVKYGYELAPPKTWQQYLDISEFFVKPGQNLWGTAEAFRRGYSFYFYFDHAASYANHPSLPGSMYFDPDTMDAQVNNPGWVRALEEFALVLDRTAPGALNFASGEVDSEFSGGRAAMNISWADTGIIAADASRSKVAGNVGSAVLPGSTEIYNYKTKSWDKYDEAISSPYMAFGGWQAAVPANSRNKEAVWHYIQYLTSPEVSGVAAVTPASGVNPYRFSHFANRDSWNVFFTPREADEYLTAQKESLNANVAIELRLPAINSYTEILEIEIAKVLEKKVSAQEALDKVAMQWNELTDQLGRDSQKAAYRAAMGLAKQ